MYQLTNISTIKEILEKHQFSFSKTLGQNFLINPDVCPHMAEICGATEKDGVLEIGPGIGVLTAELAKHAKKIVSVELDERLLPVLKTTLSDFTNITIVHGDVMKLDLTTLFAKEFAQTENIYVCANLPYYITTPIIMMLLESHLPIRAITVMVQKEAAKRICALPSTREAGAVSAAVRYYCEPRIMFYVSRGSFLPSPNVDSAVIRLDLLEKPPVTVKSEKVLFSVIRACFMQRRKTIHNALSAGLALDKQDIAAILQAADIDARKRAEQLTLEQFAVIADAVANWKQEV